MIQFPLVWLISILALIAAVTLVQNVQIPIRARILLAAFLINLGLLAGLVGIRLAGWSSWAFFLQPVIAVMVAPCAYLGFDALTRDRSAQANRMLLVTAAPILAMQLLFLARLPVPIDILILGINGFYLIRLAQLFRRGDDDFAHTAPNAMTTMRAAMLATMVLLVFMITTDLMMVFAMMSAGNQQAMAFLNGASGFLTIFTLIVAMLGAPMVMRSFLSNEPATPQASPASDQDREILSEVEAALRDKQLYRDQSMTIARLARRVGRPAREISAAINRCTQGNFSRFINTFRIRHAQQLLLESDLPVTEIMLEAGFVSKSSFNTEFKRVVGQTPTAFRQAGQSS